MDNLDVAGAQFGAVVVERFWADRVPISYGYLFIDFLCKKPDNIHFMLTHWNVF